MHEQTASNHAPILIEEPDPSDPADRPVPLVTTFLWSKQARAHRPMRCALHVRLLSLAERDRGLLWQDHLEQTTDFDGTPVVDVAQREAGLVGWVTWASTIEVPIRDYEPSGEPLGDQDERVGIWRVKVPLPPAGAFLGQDAAISLVVRPA